MHFTIRSITVLCLFSFLSCRVSAEACLFDWRETKNAKNGELEISFFVSPRDLTRLFEADAKGDTKTVEKISKDLPDDIWVYGVLLKGDLNLYPSAGVALLKYNGHELVEIRSGVVELDRKAKRARISLKVVAEGKICDFEGNGLYPIPKQGKK